MLNSVLKHVNKHPYPCVREVVIHGVIHGNLDRVQYLPRNEIWTETVLKPLMKYLTPLK